VPLIVPLLRYEPTPNRNQRTSRQRTPISCPQLRKGLGRVQASCGAAAIGVADRQASIESMFAVNAGKKKGAVSEYCAPMKKLQHNPVYVTIGWGFWFKGQRRKRGDPEASRPPTPIITLTSATFDSQAGARFKRGVPTEAGAPESRPLRPAVGLVP